MLTIQQHQIINKLEVDKDFIYLMTGPRFKHLRFGDMYSNTLTQDDYKVNPATTILGIVKLTSPDELEFYSKLYGQEDNPLGPTELEQMRNVTVCELTLGVCIDKFLEVYSQKEIEGYKVDLSAEAWYSSRKIFFYMSKGNNLIKVEIDSVNPMQEALGGVQGISKRQLRIVVSTSSRKHYGMGTFMTDLADNLGKLIKTYKL